MFNLRVTSFFFFFKSYFLIINFVGTQIVKKKEKEIIKEMFRKIPGIE